MRRSEMIAKIALEIAKQGVRNNVQNLSWLNVDNVLKVIENAGMSPRSEDYMGVCYDCGGPGEWESEEQRHVNDATGYIADE
jgi:hypothetical protein